ncbi:MAG: hypothetical protein QW404_02730 [Candidatus Nanoarchaeia archaeon]
MAELIACLSTGKGTWGHVSRIIQESDWEKVILITNEFGKENFTSEKPTEIIVIDSNKGIKEIRDELVEKLRGQIKGLEVGLNIISGSGKEHMAIIGALLKLGVGIRPIALTKDGMEEI